MKAKLLILASILVMSFGVSSCNEETVTPSKTKKISDVQNVEQESEEKGGTPILN